MRMKLSIVLAFAALLTVGCQVGPDVVMWGPCSPGSVPTGTDGQWAMACEGGVWTPVMTVDEYVAIQRGETVEIGEVPTRPTTSTSAPNTTTPTSAVPPTTGAPATTTTIAPTTTTVAPAPPEILSLSRWAGSIAGGQTVAIAGSGLSGATVMFGSAAADVTASSDTLITVTTPANPVGMVAVTVTTPNGTTTSSDEFEYGNPPTLTGVRAVGISIPGQLVFGRNFVPSDTTVTINGTPAVPFNVTATELTFRLSYTYPLRLDVTVTTPYGSATALLQES